MTELALSLGLHELDLSEEQKDAQHRWSKRSVVVLRLISGRFVGLGEAAPLPGRSLETLDACCTALTKLSRTPGALTALRELPFSEPPSDQPLARTERVISRLSELTPAELDLLPAARYGFQTAVLDYWGRRAGTPVWSMLEPNAASSVALAKLLEFEPTETLPERAKNLVSTGYRCLKLKLGNWPFEVELEALRRLRHSVGFDIALRLDANQAWQVEQARRNLAALAEVKPEFVEEPVRLEAWPELGRTEVSLAYDESLCQAPLEKLCAAAPDTNLRALVLKPMLLGGIDRCYELVREAQRASLSVVFSHVYDGPVAYSSYAALALAWQSRNLSAGLGAHRGLASFGGNIPALAGARLQRTDAPGLGLSGVPASA